MSPLLLELGAQVPARGLFVLESDVGDFGTFATAWANEHAQVLQLASGAAAKQETTHA
jgi:hypothetical protein